MEDLLTAREVARAFRLTPAEVLRLRRTGQLPAVVLSPKVIRFRSLDVERFINERLVKGSRAAQGLPPRVEDEETLTRVAGMLVPVEASK